MKFNHLLAALLSSLSVACYAADAVSGATPNHAAPGSQIKNVDAVTSASIVPQKLRISAKATGFTDSKAKKVLFVVGDPRFDQSLEGFLVNTAANFFLKKGYEVVALVAADDRDELVGISEKGITIRIPADQISSKKAKGGQGVILQRLEEGDRIASIDVVSEPEEDEENS